MFSIMRATPAASFRFCQDVVRTRSQSHIAARMGFPIDGEQYNDIAIIQYNKKNGALCFYQALSNLPGDDIPPPRDGAPWNDGKAHWISPMGTEAMHRVSRQRRFHTL